MAPGGAAASSSKSKGHYVEWRPTKMMNVLDLSRDDDFLSHILVEKLGTASSAVPLLVHRMDNSRRLPKTDAEELLSIVRRLVGAKGAISNAARHAVDELLRLTAVRYFIRNFDQKQINAFSTHASRYFELYNPLGSIEICHTSRYSHRTGKAELCILATRPLTVGMVISELKGSMATLSEEEDTDLKRTDLRNSDIRRDFSVIHSKQMKRNHLFLGPARFVNHDCDNNCEIFREGRYITFRVLRPIVVGQELTAHYGAGYFGRKNRHCLCETCERRGRGGYAPNHSDGGASGSDIGDDSDESDAEVELVDPEERRKKELAALKVNERRTRRGVYATVVEEDSTESEQSEEEGEPPKVLDSDGISELSSLAPESVVAGAETGLLTPASSALTSPPRGSLSPMSSIEDVVAVSSSASAPPAPFRSIISTRRQKANMEAAGRQQDTPPLTEDNNSVTEGSSSARQTRSSTSAVVKSAKAKGKEKAVDTPPPVSRNTHSASASVPPSKGKGNSVEPKAKVGRPTLLALAAAALAKAKANVAPLPPPKPEVPRGPDGKPLPLCASCSNVLPIITVDSQVMQKPQACNNRKPECPRCMRHFAIYGNSWPVRVSPEGPSYAGTPRDDRVRHSGDDSSTRKVTTKALPVLDEKLASASVGSRRSRRYAEITEEDYQPRSEPVTKKQRTESLPAITTRAAASASVGVSTRSSAMAASSSSGRVTRSAVVTKEEEESSSSEEEEPAEEEKVPYRTGRRGRPRKYAREPGTTPPPPPLRKGYKKPPPRAVPAAEKTYIMANGATVSQHVVDEVWNANVGKKKKLSRAERAVHRGKVKNWLETTTVPVPSKRKRVVKEPESSDDEAEVVEAEQVPVAVVEDEEERPSKRVRLDVPSQGFKGMGLLGKPNPFSFARKGWAKKDDDEPPATSLSSRNQDSYASLLRLSTPPTDAYEPSAPSPQKTSPRMSIASLLRDPDEKPIQALRSSSSSSSGLSSALTDGVRGVPYSMPHHAPRLTIPSLLGLTVKDEPDSPPFASSSQRQLDRGSSSLSFQSDERRDDGPYARLNRPPGLGSAAFGSAPRMPLVAYSSKNMGATTSSSSPPSSPAEAKESRKLEEYGKPSVRRSSRLGAAAAGLEQMVPAVVVVVAKLPEVSCVAAELALPLTAKHVAAFSWTPKLVPVGDLSILSSSSDSLRSNSEDIPAVSTEENTMEGSSLSSAPSGGEESEDGSSVDIPLVKQPKRESGFEQALGETVAALSGRL